MQDTRRRGSRKKVMLALLVAPTVLALAVAAAVVHHLSPATEGEVRALMATVSPAVEQARGLAFKHPANVKVITVEEALAIQDGRRQAGEASRLKQEKQRLARKAAVQLGLLPEGNDAKAGIQGVLKDTATGWYDTETDVLYVVDGRPRAGVSRTLAHELTHALDYQYFPWSASYKAMEDDQALAFKMVFEGSAVSTASRVSKERRARVGASGGKFRSTPVLVQRIVNAPYVLGPLFLGRGMSELSRGEVRAVAARPDDINRAFEKPPESTEQILHPEKYWSPEKHDGPRPVALPDLSAALGQEWTLKVDGVLGELQLAVLTEATPAGASDSAALASQYTNPGASGWGGDRYQYYESGAKSATVLGSVWDSEAEAVEFEASVVQDPPKVVKRRGDSVVCIAASPDVKTDGLLAAALDALEKARR
jgi:hypothetical protein